MFYPNTPEGEKRAAEFAKQQDRPGWGVFYCPNPFRDDIDLQQAFNDVVQMALDHPPS